MLFNFFLFLIYILSIYCTCSGVTKLASKSPSFDSILEGVTKALFGFILRIAALLGAYIIGLPLWTIGLCFVMPFMILIALILLANLSNSKIEAIGE